MNHARNTLRIVAVFALVAAVVAIGNMVGGKSVAAQSPAEAGAHQIRVAAWLTSEGTAKLAGQYYDGADWSEPVEPDGNELPTSDDARLQRWFDTGTVDFSGHEFRLSARRLEDGRLELALQEMNGDEPGWRHLTEYRWIPADSPTGQWLATGPIRLFADDDPLNYVPRVTNWGRHAVNVAYNSYVNHERKVTSWVQTDSEEGGQWGADDYGGRLHIACDHGRSFNVTLDGLSVQTEEALPVILTIDGVPQPAADWRVRNWPSEEPTHAALQPPDKRALYQQLRHASRVSAEVAGVGGTHTWYLTETFRTPIQDNLDRCGYHVLGQVRVPSPTYVPVINDWTRRGDVILHAHFNDDGSVNSRVDTMHPETDVRLRQACWGTNMVVEIVDLPYIETLSVAVAWNIDDHGSVVEFWDAQEQWRSDDTQPRRTYLSPPSANVMLERLRAGRSFTIWIDTGDVSPIEIDLGNGRLLDQLAAAGGFGPITFDLRHTFNTPLQGNIDECGNIVRGESREAVYEQYVPIANASGTTAHGHDWSAGTWNDDGTFWTAVRNHQPLPGGGSTALDLHCNGQGGVGFVVGSAPLIEAEQVEATLRLDDGEAITEQWRYHEWGSEDNRHANFASPDVRDLIARLKRVSTLTFEVAEHSFGPVTFNVAGFFDTPIQPNIDNCRDYQPSAQRELDPRYVPIVNANGSVSDTLTFEANQGDQGIASYANHTLAHDDAPGGALRLRVGCWSSDRPDVKIEPLPVIEDATGAEVTILINGYPKFRETWHLGTYGDTMTAFAANSGALYNLLRRASSVTIEIDGAGLGPLTFDLSGMFDTPIQENIDECGRYRPGETRELQTTQSQQDSSIGHSVTRGGGTIPFSFAWQTRQQNGAEQYYLRFGCSTTGAELRFRGAVFGDLSGTEVDVVWAIDDGVKQLQTWNVDGTSEPPWVSPDSAAATISAWRGGTTLSLTLVTDTPHTERFDLAGLFGTAAQDSMDECLVAERPEHSLPAGLVAPNTDGNTSYRSARLYGAGFDHTALWVRLPSDSAPDWAGYSTTFVLWCGIDGRTAIVYGVGLDRSVAIAGGTISVTYSVNGGPGVSRTWDVWPFTSNAYNLSPQDDQVFYQAIQGADTLTITVASDPEFVETYDLAGNGFWETPVQPNLDACGG